MCDHEIGDLCGHRLRRVTVLFTVSCLLLTFGVFGSAQEPPGKPRLILDADTANEIDDLYAIVRTLRQGKFEVLGLNSAQWIHYLGTKDSVQASQKLNEELVTLLDRTDLPTPMGSNEPMGKPWGGDEPKDSEAARFIVQSALATPEGQKLNVLCIGAQTNLASAIKLNPEIAVKIRAYVLGFKFDREKNVWDKSEFNVRRDLNAADFLLNQQDLELHIMTATASEALKFVRDDSFARQARMGELGQFLTDKWKERFPDSKAWTMWDVAAVQAIIHPELASQELVMTPPENVQRKVWVYYKIDADRMRDDFWRSATSEPEERLCFLGDFEHGVIPLTLENPGSPWYLHGNSPEVVSAPEPVRHGRFAMKSVLDREKSPISYRTEVIAKIEDKQKHPKMGEDYWYGFSLYFPDDWTEDTVWEIVAQWHGVPDKHLGEVSRNPVMAFHSDGTTLKITNIWDTAAHTQEAQQTRESRYSGGATLWEGPIRTGHWTDWVVHVKWSYKDDGYMEVWRDGKQIAKRTGPNTFNDQRAPYFKMGIYKGWRSRKEPKGKVSRRVIYHDEVRFAGPNGNYSDVAPPMSE